jgi:NAD-dependent deacetylase
MERDVEELGRLVARARRPVVVTGSGVSVASGLPTYRGPGGLWTTNPEAQHPEGPPGPDVPEDEARAFWDRSWSVWGSLRVAGAAAAPNPAHLALAAWQRAVPDLVVVTQNVDGLDGRAGTDGVVELHGTLWRNRCTRPECGPPWSDHEPHAAAPPCPRCGRPARLDVVMFGEVVDPPTYHRVKRAVKDADLLVVVGTSGLVSPVSDLPWLASDYGVPIARVDPGPWGGRRLPWAVEVAGPAEVVLPAAVPPSSSDDPLLGRTPLPR